MKCKSIESEESVFTVAHKQSIYRDSLGFLFFFYFFDILWIFPKQKIRVNPSSIVAFLVNEQQAVVERKLAGKVYNAIIDVNGLIGCKAEGLCTLETVNCTVEFWWNAKLELIRIGNFAKFLRLADVLLDPEITQVGGALRKVEVFIKEDIHDKVSSKLLVEYTVEDAVELR